MNCGVGHCVCLVASTAWPTLGTEERQPDQRQFMGGTETEISFRVGSSIQKYNLAESFR